MAPIVRTVLLLALACSVPAWAASASDIREVESALARVTAEQQSVYQQFQMMQVMLRSEEAKAQPPTYTPPASPPNYDDVIREQSARSGRIKRYQDELERLYSRYQDLELQRSQLAQSLSELAQQRRESR